MRVIMFQPQFEAKIQDGIKVHTIRKTARCKQYDDKPIDYWTARP